MEGSFQNVFYEILNFFTNIGWSIIFQLRIIDRSSSNKKLLKKLMILTFLRLTPDSFIMGKRVCADRQALQTESETLLK